MQQQLEQDYRILYLISFDILSADSLVLQFPPYQDMLIRPQPIFYLAQNNA
jgi:hypothetical protein